MDVTKVLPQDCISFIISFTSPKDACRLSLVSPSIKAASDSDFVWESFLPSDYRDIISSSSQTLNSMTKKQIYLHLCDHPVLLAGGNMTLYLEKATGKKCCVVGAKRLQVVWGDNAQHWQWISMMESRFSEVAVLNYVWWLEVKGSLETKHLSPNTNYGIYFVYAFGESTYGFEDMYVEFCVCGGTINESRTRAILYPPGERVQQREDEWLEVEMGEFFNGNGNEQDGLMDFRLWEINGTLKSGLIVDRVEFRPKDM